MSTCPGFNPAPVMRSIWAVNSRRRSSGSMRLAAMRGRNTRHDDASRPRPSTSDGTSRAVSSGGSSPTAARWAPTPIPPVSRRAATDGPNPGASASTDVLVTMPSRWDRRMARETAGVRP